jgi:hypothetical protein
MPEPFLLYPSHRLCRELIDESAEATVPQKFLFGQSDVYPG